MYRFNFCADCWHGHVGRALVEVGTTFTFTFTFTFTLLLLLHYELLGKYEDKIAPIVLSHLCMIIKICLFIMFLPL